MISSPFLKQTSIHVMCIKFFVQENNKMSEFSCCAQNVWLQALTTRLHQCIIHVSGGSHGNLDIWPNDLETIRDEVLMMVNNPVRFGASSQKFYHFISKVKVFWQTNTHIGMHTHPRTQTKDNMPRSYKLAGIKKGEKYIITLWYKFSKTIHHQPTRINEQLMSVSGF